MVETKTNLAELKRVRSLEAEVKQLNQQLAEKDKELQKAEAKLERQEKLANLGLTTAETLHDTGNLLGLILSSTRAVSKRLDFTVRTLDEASLCLDQEITNDFFSEILRNYIPGSKKSLRNIEDKVEQINKITEKVKSYLKSDLSLEQKEVKETNESKRLNSEELVLTDVNTLVRDCLKQACKVGQNKKIQQGGKKLDLNSNINFDSSIGEVKINQENFRRILINLIDNAFYTVYEKAQKLGDSYQPTISVSTEKTADVVIITVEDNGEGIEKGFREVFKPFVSNKSEQEGTGLGLSIVKKLCQESSIKLRAKTEPGKFTKFILNLEPVIA